MVTKLIPDEKRDIVHNTLLHLCMELHPPDGPNAMIKVDPAPGLRAIRGEKTLDRFRISIEEGCVKNPNKNPVAEKAISEIENELLKQEPRGSNISPLILSPLARLNSRACHSGLSAREMLTQRNQFTNDQLPITDKDLITQKHNNRRNNHPSCSLSKSYMRGPHQQPQLSIGDLVHL